MGRPVIRIEAVGHSSLITPPPYRRSHAYKIVADFEHAVREHEMLGAAHPADRPGIIQRYEEERIKLVHRLSLPKDKT